MSTLARHRIPEQPAARIIGGRIQNCLTVADATFDGVVFRRARARFRAWRRTWKS